MSSDTSQQSRGRRDTADLERDRAVYRYLLSLTDIQWSGEPKTPNETGIARQWDVDRIFVRRMLRAVLADRYESKPQPAPSLSLSKLVSILAALKAHRQEPPPSPAAGGLLRRLLSRSEILTALRLWFQLHPDERHQLDLPAQSNEQMLSEIWERIAACPDVEASDRTIQLYDFFLQQSVHRTAVANVTVRDSAKLTSADLVERLVSDHVDRHFAGLSQEARTDEIRSLVHKIKREINRVEIQTGIEQANTLLSKEFEGYPGQQDDSDISSDGFFEDPRLRRYMPPAFVQQLAQSVLENELITDEFPIYIKYFEIERVKPLPLYVRQDNETKGLLNPHLLQTESEVDNIKGLERQVAYRVRVHFYIKKPQDYDIRFEDITTKREVAGQERIEFYEEVVGVGSPISHITAVINRVLLWDIPVLRDYVPIADSVHIHSSNVTAKGEPNSPVWSHCVARLHRYEDVTKAIETGQDCEAVAIDVETASADFCGYDLLETTAKAVLHTRLKLIKQVIALDPTTEIADYMHALCCRVEELGAMRRSHECLKNYPFSLRAMEGQLEATLFANGRYRQRQEGFDFEVEKPNQPWSDVAFDAHLKIANANLKEGLFRVARKYLDLVKPYLEDAEEGKVGDLLLAQYHLCWFRYYYLVDLRDQDCLFPDRFVAIREAEQSLFKAETFLKRRLRRYDKLDELPQSNLHPQFYLLSRVYAHRAKLHIFFSPYMMAQPDPMESLLEPLRLLEKARIYAARDGDPALYAQWSAYQSWCYIMVAYLGESAARPLPNFGREDCLDWAKRLIEHASVCYSQTGKACYQKIKYASGQTTEYATPASVVDEVIDLETAGPDQISKGKLDEKYYEQFGSTWVQVMPLIQELTQPKAQQSYIYSKGPVVKLNVSLLKQDTGDENSAIYRFGMQSSILLFAEGMLSLCDTAEDDAQLISNIQEKALRQFAYCAAIAADGTRRQSDRDLWPQGIPADSLVLDREIPHDEPRLPHDRDSIIQCLYPHRLTQFADLGKVFIIVCELVLVVAFEAGIKAAKTSLQPDDIKARKAEIYDLIATLKTNNKFPFPPPPEADTCGQTRYNGHLAEHYIQLERFANDILADPKRWLSKPSRGQKLGVSAVRDQIATVAFEILRGGSYSAR